MVDVNNHAIHVGKYTVRPVDPSWELLVHTLINVKTRLSPMISSFKFQTVEKNHVVKRSRCFFLKKSEIPRNTSFSTRISSKRPYTMLLRWTFDDGTTLTFLLLLRNDSTAAESGKCAKKLSKHNFPKKFPRIHLDLKERRKAS